MNKNTYVAIIAGGIGSRFWPRSRASHPKQFLDLLNNGQSLIQSTFNRFKDSIDPKNIFVVTTKEYVDLVKQHLPTLNPDNILAEPSRKNTAPCIAYVCFKLFKINPDASLIVTPADHNIVNNEPFIENCIKATHFAKQKDALVTLGIKPTHPNTGYGYIQYDETQAIDGFFKVKTFTEKPSLDIAKTFLESGDFLWNAGIFIWHIPTLLKAYQQLQPELYELFLSALPHFGTANEMDALQSIYPQCASISIDYAILEKATNVYVLPSSFGWSDLGTWSTAYDISEKDYLGNAVSGKNIFVVDATKCVISADNKKLLIVQGLDNFIVVDTPDALLICQKEKEQEIKEYVAEVKRNKGEHFL